MAESLNQKKSSCGFDFKKFDIFGESISLRVGGKTTFQTKYGSCLSFIFYIFVAISLVNYSIQFFATNEPTTQYEQTDESASIEADIGNNSVAFFFVPMKSIAHGSTPPYHLTEYVNASEFLANFEITAIKNVYTTEYVNGVFKEQIISQTNIPILQCSQTTWYNGLTEDVMESYIKGVMGESGLCLDPPKDMTIHGMPNNSDFSSVKIKIKPCLACTPTIDVNSITIKLGYLDNSIDLSDDDMPWKQYYRLNVGTKLNINNTVVTCISLKTHSIVTNYGRIFARENTEEKPSIHDLSNYYIYRVDSLDNSY